MIIIVINDEMSHRYHFLCSIPNEIFEHISTYISSDMKLYMVEKLVMTYNFVDISAISSYYHHQ